MATLSLRNLKKSYDDHPVIHGVDIDIADGEFMVIVGPSGCGKSTLLRMIAGLEEVSQGDIILNDRRVNRIEPKKRNIAMVFQNYALYPHMSVYDNMAYGLKLRGVKKRDIATMVAKTAEILKIEEVLQRKPSALSGGQRQRVAMGRAMVRQPEIFLFDEPLSNLDAKLRVQMRLEIKTLQRKLNITSVYVTHDQVEAMTLADRLIVLNAGRVEQIGTPLEIYHHPQSMFVAGFLGSPAMNFLPAYLDANLKQCVIGTLLTFHHQHPDLMSLPNQSIQLGFRPEDLKLKGEGELQLPLRIDDIEMLGADCILYGHLQSDPHPITLRMKSEQALQSGDSIKVGVNLSDLHYFNRESGKSLLSG